MKKLGYILLIDDDQIANYICCNLFKKINYSPTIRVALNGTEGIKVLKEGIPKEKYPDLIFLDINMPVKNGFEFVEEFNLLTFTNPPKIVVLTTSSDSRDIQKFKDLGIVDFINKPLTLLKLNEALGNWFDFSKAFKNQ